MSQPIGNLYQPFNQYPVPVYSGWSWPCFFFGVFWFLAKGLLGHAVLAFLICIFTAGFGWFFLPLVANQWHYDSLRKKGCLTEEQLLAKTTPPLPA